MYLACAECEQAVRISDSHVSLHTMTQCNAQNSQLLITVITAVRFLMVHFTSVSSEGLFVVRNLGTLFL